MAKAAVGTTINLGKWRVFTSIFLGPALSSLAMEVLEGAIITQEKDGEQQVCRETSTGGGDSVQHEGIAPLQVVHIVWDGAQDDASGTGDVTYVQVEGSNIPAEFLLSPTTASKTLEGGASNSLFDTLNAQVEKSSCEICQRSFFDDVSLKRHNSIFHASKHRDSFLR